MRCSMSYQRHSNHWSMGAGFSSLIWARAGEAVRALRARTASAGVRHRPGKDGRWEVAARGARGGWNEEVIRDSLKAEEGPGPCGIPDWKCRGAKTFVTQSIARKPFHRNPDRIPDTGLALVR